MATIPTRCHRLAIMSFMLSGIAGLCLPGTYAASTGDSSPVGFSRFIGPDDCPGIDQFADPYVLKQGDAWYIFKNACHLVFHAHNPGQTSGGGQGRWVWLCQFIIHFKAPLTEWLKPILPAAKN